MKKSYLDLWGACARPPKMTACRLFLLATLFFIIRSLSFAADETHTIVQKNRAFHPAEVTINKGEALTFTNNDAFIHQIYVDAKDFSFDTDEQSPGQDVNQRFTQSGTFEVRCHIHPTMKLVVHVK